MRPHQFPFLDAVRDVPRRTVTLAHLSFLDTLPKEAGTTTTGKPVPPGAIALIMTLWGKGKDTAEIASILMIPEAVAASVVAAQRGARHSSNADAVERANRNKARAQQKRWDRDWEARRS